MTDGDSLTLSSVRIDLDKDIREELKDRRLDVSVMEWWRLLKLDGECAVGTIKDKGIVSGDGVHLCSSMNRTAAVVLCHRFMEGAEEEWSETDSVQSKRRRLE